MSKNQTSRQLASVLIFDNTGTTRIVLEAMDVHAFFVVKLNRSAKKPN
jgi:hypothetical protein